jgi:peptide deformylase
VAVRPVVRYPARALKAGTKPTAGIGDEERQLAEDLVDTMLEAPGCVGLAAPQIDVPVRAFVLDVSRMRKPPPNHGLVVMFNPEIVLAEGTELRREGCLSVPDFTCDIRRATTVVVRLQTPEGGTRILETAGFEARAVLHEIDHLDGQLILDRVASARTDVHRRKRYAKPGEHLR